jgi:Rieske Fe-S protein
MTWKGGCGSSGTGGPSDGWTALDAVCTDLGAPTKSALEQAMKGHVLSQADLIGTYQKR